MDGVEICEQVNARFPHVPVVIYSATDERACPPGSVAFVAKPSDPTFLAVIDRHCQKD